MGDPRKIRSKYKTPMHPWQKDRLDREKPLMKIYGLSNKKELWKVDSKLKNYKDNAKKLVVRKGSQADIEKKQLVEKLKSLNLLASDSMDDILDLSIEQLLDRRLQTLVTKKGLARTNKQARQMITHGHISVGGKKMTSPGYLVKVSEEDTLVFNNSSAFISEDHPERKIPEQLAEAPKAEEKKEEPKKKVHKKKEALKAVEKKVKEKKVEK